MLHRLLGQFPTLPTMTANWVPVRIEPIPGSGELLTVAVALQMEGQQRVISAIPPEVAHAVFGEQGTSMLGIIGTVSNHLKNFLLHGGNLEDWKSPLSGVKAGELEVGQGNTMEEIIEQALRSTACLSAMTLAFQSRQEAGDEPKNILLTKVRNSLRAIAPQLDQFMNKDVPITIRNKPVKVHCDYYSQNLAINFAALAPGSRLGQQFEALTARICRLQQLKSHEGLLKETQATEVIVKVPTEAMLADNHRPKHVQDFRDRFLMAQDLAEDRGVAVVEAHTPDDCAKIIKSEEGLAA